MSTSPLEQARRGVLPAFWDRVRSEEWRRGVALVLVLAACAFPLIDHNEGDLDAAANATAFATLALGLNIVVGFAGLLDLGYAAFFAIGAYTYGIFSSYQIQPEWSSFWEPFQWLGFVSRLHVDGVPIDHAHFQVSFWLMLPVSALVAAFLRRRIRRADAAPQGRLPRDRDARVRRDRADRRPQYTLPHQRCPGPQRCVATAPLRVQFRCPVDAVLLPRRGAGRIPDLRERPPQGQPHRPCVACDPRGRDRRGGDGRQPHQTQAAGLRGGRGVRRHDRHLLRRQAADRDPRRCSPSRSR